MSFSEDYCKISGTHNYLGEVMKGEVTAIIEKAPEGGYWAICPEVPGANGQGETIEEAKASLKEAVSLIIYPVISKCD